MRTSRAGPHSRPLRPMPHNREGGRPVRRMGSLASSSNSTISEAVFLVGIGGLVALANPILRVDASPSIPTKNTTSEFSFLGAELTLM